ncbi:MAG TPA: heme ABC exporter ATP-binding protein CcmA [Allosphingosinicella sp.]
MSAAPLLALEAVACLRGGRLLFEDLSLRLAPGEAALATGPNGAGKSSLLRVAGGLLPAAAGRVVRSGGAALADEGLALDPRLPLGRALGFWAKLDGGDAGEGMAAMGLARLAAVPVRMLSTGQRKRAALARVIASRAPLWLLDEPANGLDAEGLERLAAAMAAHRAAGGAILAASHVPVGLDDAKAVRL